jgi:hypothetical protein
MGMERAQEGMHNCKKGGIKKRGGPGTILRLIFKSGRLPGTGIFQYQEWRY